VDLQIALTIRLPPMLIPLLLIAKPALTSPTPCMLLRHLQVPVHLHPRFESQQTCQTHKLVSDAVIVLEMVLQSPLILEGRKTQVTVHLVVPRVVNMVLQPIPVLEYSLAEVAVVLVLCRLLHMREQRVFARKLDGADAAPVLVRVVHFLVALVCGHGNAPHPVSLVKWAGDGCFRPVLDRVRLLNSWLCRLLLLYCRGATTLFDLLPRNRVIGNLIQKWILRGVEKWFAGRTRILVVAGEERIAIVAVHRHIFRFATVRLESLREVSDVVPFEMISK